MKKRRGTAGGWFPRRVVNSRNPAPAADAITSALG